MDNWERRHQEEHLKLEKKMWKIELANFYCSISLLIDTLVILLMVITALRK